MNYMRFRLHDQVENVYSDIYSAGEWWGCFLTKIFLPFDENNIYLPNDEFVLLAWKIYPFLSLMTKILD